MTSMICSAKRQSVKYQPIGIFHQMILVGDIMNTL